MEVRCDGCMKLFRISDEKITGKGIKFTCTKCGQAVKVTREEFEQYQLSLSAVSVLDSFVPKPKTPPAAPELQKSEPQKTEVSEQKPSETKPLAESKQPEPPVPVQVSTVPHEPAPSESAIPDFLQEKEEQAAFDSSPLIELPQASAPGASGIDESLQANENPFAVMEQPQEQQEHAESAAMTVEKPVTTTVSASPSLTSQPVAAVTSETPQPAPEPKPAPFQEPAVAPPPAPKPEAAATAEAQQHVADQRPVATVPPSAELKAAEKTEAVAAELEKKPESKPESKIESAIADKLKPAPQPKPKPAPPASAQAQKKVTPRPAASAQRRVVTAAPPKPPSSNLIILIVAAVILLLLIGAGAYFLLMPESSKVSPAMVSPVGLRIENTAYQAEPNGDLVITGMVVNEAEKAQDAWLVEVDAFDASGGVIKKMRVFKGKQLFSKSDYDILQKRGVNIQELKAQIRSNQGTTIPPKSSVKFEVRYLQSPPSIANLQTILQPYDPVRLEKEISADTQ